MIIITNKRNIEYTKGDTFEITVWTDKENYFTPGMQLKLVIAESEQSDDLINKTFDIAEDLVFNLTLSDSEIEKLELGNYYYKLIVLKNNTVVTQQSGDFIVKWGA